MSKIVMTIEADGPDEFRKVLLGLLGDVRVNVTQLDVKGNDPDRAVTQMVDTAKDKATSKPATAAKPKDTAKAAATDTKAEAGKTGPKLVEPATEFAEEEKAKPEPPKEKAKAKPSPAPDTQAAAGGPELPDNIKNTNSMRDLLTYLAEHGVDSADAMVATCTVLKKDVPILSKVPNVEERVRRALDVLALFPAPTEGDAAQA